MLALCGPHEMLNKSDWHMLDAIKGWLNQALILLDSVLFVYVWFL